MSPPRPRSDRPIVLRLPRHTVKIAGIAFAAGLLLFLLIWLSGRKNEFYTAGPAQPVAPAPGDIQPLPEPLPAGDGASDMPEAPAPAASEDAPQLVENTSVPPPTALPEGDPATLPPGQGPAALAPSDRPTPLPGQAPPRYPPAALRRGDRGTVVLRVDVDAGGLPGGVTLIRRSGSRDLDRAAMETVRRWRFQPAQDNGRPVAGSLEIPFEFTPGQ